MNAESDEMAIKAAHIYRTLRKKGNTIRKSNDYLIAAHAIVNNLEILHVDRDFKTILGGRYA